MDSTVSIIYLLVAFVNFSDGSISITVTKELTNAGFAFDCVLSPDPVTDLVVFESPSGTSLGGCAAPVSSTTSGVCNSPTSPASTVTQELSTRTTSIDIPAGYIIGNTGLTGNWKCKHGSDEATVTYSNILAFNQDGVSFTSHTSGELSADSLTTITFRMNCLYPSATYFIEYLDNDAGNKVKYTQTLLSSACTNVAASCTTADSNAFGQDCTFNVDKSHLASKTKIQVKARVTGMQTTNYPTIVSNFIIKKETTTVHGTSSINLGTTETSEDPQNLSILTTEFTTSSSETITSDASTTTSSQFTVTTDIVSTTHRDLDVDDLLLATVVSSIVGGIILIVILAFVLYFLIKKIRVPSRKKNQLAHEMEGFDNKGMTQEIYSNKHKKGRNGLDSNTKGIGNYRPKSLGTSYSIPYVGNGNPMRSRSEIGNDGYIQSSGRMYPSLPYAAHYSKPYDVAAIQTRNMHYNDRYLQHGHL